MKHGRILAGVLAIALAGQIAAGAEVKKKEDPELGSVFVRCDGSPAHRSGAETAGRILLIMATAGLAGPGEMKNTSKRLTGPEAVTACDTALAGETDPIRRVQLTLARAIHHIEAKQFDAALADAQAAPGLAGKDGTTLGFRHSLYISALDLEAAALVRLNRPADAEAVGLKLAAVAPYDIISQQRASRYVGLTDSYTPEKLAFLDRIARIYPHGQFAYANAAEWAGHFKTAADLLQSYVDIVRGFGNEKEPAPPMAGIEARIAIDLALAGELPRSNELAVGARKKIDEMVASGKALTMQNIIAEGEELLDFQAVISQIGSGKIVEARAAFAARSRWSVTPIPLVAEVTARLRAGAKPADLTGALAKTPADIRKNGLAALIGAITEASDADQILYSAVRPPLTGDEFKYWNDDIREVKDSDFIVKRTAKTTYTGDLIYMKRANGLAAGDAALMHCAFLAKYRGVKGFVLFPSRKQYQVLLVQFGNPGQPGFPEAAFVDADTVIAGLAEEFPEKPKKK